MTGRRGVAIGATITLALAAFIAYSLASMVDFFENINPANPFEWALGFNPLVNGLDVGYALRLLLLSIVLLVAAVPGLPSTRHPVRMSLFVAVRPDEAAVEDLSDALEPVRRMPAAQALRWQPASQWHITVAFLGDADEDVTDEVAERLAALDLQAIPGVRLAGADCFGRQILWIGIGDDEARARMGATAAAIPPRLRGLGLDVDRRAWRGHLTVARARNGDARSAAAVLAGYRGPSWDAHELLVIRSTGGPRPAHHVVHVIPLAEPC